MASVHKHPRTPYYQAAFRDSEGVLISKSTKAKDRSRAMSIALEYERLAKTPSSLTEAQVRRSISNLMERIGHDPIRSPSAKTFLNDWLNAKKLHLSESSATRYASTISQFLDSLGRKSAQPISSIIAKDFQLFIESRLLHGCSPSTVSVDVKTIRGAFNSAVKQNLISNNPADAVELPKQNPVQREGFSPAEVNMLIEAAEGEWKDLILIGYCTGARLKDCTLIRWENVDLTKRCISFAVHKKGGKLHSVPINEQLENRLMELANKDCPTEFVLPEMANKGPGGRHGLSEGFKRIMKRAGLDLKTVQGSGKRRISRRTFHALRHSFASLLANAGVAEELRMKLTGHKSKRIHQDYTHHEFETLREAMACLPTLQS